MSRFDDYAFEVAVQHEVTEYDDRAHDAFTVGRVYLGDTVIWKADDMPPDASPRDVIEQFAAVLRDRLGDQT